MPMEEGSTLQRGPLKSPREHRCLIALGPVLFRRGRIDDDDAGSGAIITLSEITPATSNPRLA